jgi:hypothetical protein
MPKKPRPAADIGRFTLGEIIDAAVADALANATIDAGTFGDPSSPAAVQSRKVRQPEKLTATVKAMLLMRPTGLYESDTDKSLAKDINDTDVKTSPSTVKRARPIYEAARKTKMDQIDQT